MNKVHKNGRFIFCFFSRNGGVSKGNFSSLNCSYNIEEDKRNVKNNRDKARSLINPEKKIVFVNQIHSNKVIVIKKKSSTKLMYADAMISERKDILLGILTADCAPIVTIGRNYFGIIHAGWKVALSGIIENAINFFLKKGEHKENIFVDVGPHLRKDSFEVKNDFIVNLKKLKIDSDKYISSIKKNLYFNFSSLIKDKIINCGIHDFNISEIDTYQNNNEFYSYRYYSKKGIKNCGRQISLVSIKDNNEIGFR